MHPKEAKLKLGEAIVTQFHNTKDAAKAFAQFGEIHLDTGVGVRVTAFKLGHGVDYQTALSVRSGHVFLPRPIFEPICKGLKNI